MDNVDNFLLSLWSGLQQVGGMLCLVWSDLQQVLVDELDDWSAFGGRACGEMNQLDEFLDKLCFISSAFNSICLFFFCVPSLISLWSCFIAWFVFHPCISCFRLSRGMTSSHVVEESINHAVINTLHFSLRKLLPCSRGREPSLADNNKGFM